LDGTVLEGEHRVVTLQAFAVSTVQSSDSGEGPLCTYVECCEVPPVGIEGVVVELDKLF
jgi:hypothetical protein